MQSSVHTWWLLNINNTNNLPFCGMLANNCYNNATCDISQRAGLLKYIQGKDWIIGLGQGGVLLPPLERSIHKRSTHMWQTLRFDYCWHSNEYNPNTRKMKKNTNSANQLVVYSVFNLIQMTTRQNDDLSSRDLSLAWAWARVRAPNHASCEFSENLAEFPR